MIEVKPGSPEDRILMAVIEAIEASGEVITPRIREHITCFFMMGYIAGSSIFGAEALMTFLGPEEVKKQKMFTVEETIEDLIKSVNRVLLGRLSGGRDAPTGA